MAKIFITGSTDGLGLLSARTLIQQGHEVVFHARNAARGHEVLNLMKEKHQLVVGDLLSLTETIKVARQVNALGSFDAIIHNAGIYQASGKEIFAVNTLAPYVLTSLIKKPKRLVYLSSGMHLQGRSDILHIKKDVNQTNYSDSKLHVLALVKIISQAWPGVYSNAVNPGWVPTKMGGKGAPDDLQKGAETQVWLATSDGQKAKITGRYFFHKQEGAYHPAADNKALQESLIKLCFEHSGIKLPQF